MICLSLFKTYTSSGKLSCSNRIPQIKWLEFFDLQNFPSAKRIENSNYYYSYHRSGCADMNWDSDLFYIENYKIVKIGNISGNECADTDVKDGIYISKIQGEKQTEIAKLPISTIKRYKDYKWGFIKQYWHKNYKKFL